MIAGAHSRMQNGALGKVVLSRCLSIEASQEFSVPAILNRLHLQFPTAFVFAYAIHGKCFLGASPERLIRVEGLEIESMALAGTARRGATPEEDESLAAALLESGKERAEHSFVTAMLREKLAPICASLEIPGRPELMRLENVQHLLTRVRGCLRERKSVLELVRLLHPTPAVGGYPNAPALQCIRGLETHDRGWYAGPLGSFGAEGDFAVALRCAWIHGRQAKLYAGCGIVRESVAEKEFAETEHKFQAMRECLGVGPHGKWSS
jgi:isochorismate synthase